jgi:ADP-ribosylglycohydrolase
MIGAIAGDIIGSVYEGRPIKTKDFPLFQPHCTFTDDSVLTVAVARAILEGRSYLDTIRELGQQYPDVGYSCGFHDWLLSRNPQPYNSFGSGAAMRVSPVGWAFATREEVLREATRSAEITHNHPEGIKGAQATALAVWLCRNGIAKEALRAEIERTFRYHLQRTVDEMRPTYHYDSSCIGSVPQAMISFLDSTSWEDAVRNAVSLGGDSDTLACIAGAIAEAFYGPVPTPVQQHVQSVLTPDLWAITSRFCARYVSSPKTARTHCLVEKTTRCSS